MPQFSSPKIKLLSQLSETRCQEEGNCAIYIML